MFCKIFKHGRGRGCGIDYLMSLKDAQSKPRMPPAQLMRGNIFLTKRLINGSKFAQKYTSGVLSWAESTDQISQTTLDEVMESFETMLGTGLTKERLNWLWVMHTDKGRIELHWIVPNVDLLSGKRFAPYFDRTDRMRFRAWERLTNKVNGFADPSDPARKKDLRLPSNLPPNKVQAVQLIHNTISALVSQKTIKNRDDIIRKLKQDGYLINRQGKDYLSIEDNKGQKLRLKGAFYVFDFNVKNLDQINSHEKESSEKSIEILQDELSRQIEKRLSYIRSRYANSGNAQEVNHEVNKFPSADKLQLKFTAPDLHVPTTESVEKNDSTRKFAERLIKGNGSGERPTISGIDYSINEFGHTAAIFYKSFQYFVERVGRSIKHLKASTSNRFIY